MSEMYALEVLAHRPVAADHFEIVLPKIGKLRDAEPGQFVNVVARSAESYDPLLRRPFSFYAEDSETISLLYRVIGRGTRYLAGLRPGSVVDLIGPLGQGFSYRDMKPDGGRAILVGGGVGVPPIYHLSQRLAEAKIPFAPLVGFASRDFAVGVSRWRSAGIDVRVSTDDGSMGRAGWVTQLLEEELQRGDVARVFACGPRGMLRSVASLCAQAGAPCQVALEEWMGCGVGACLSCVVLVRSKGDVAWARVCKEGPVFDASEVAWNDA